MKQDKEKLSSTVIINNKHVFYDNQQYLTYKVVTNIVVFQGFKEPVLQGFYKLGELLRCKIPSTVI